MGSQNFNSFTPLGKAGTEAFEKLFENDNVLIERIVSNGQASPEGFWYDQETDEWVVLLSGTAEIEYSTGEIIALSPGDHIFIPAHCRHRVKFVSEEPNAVWVAVHIK